MILAADVGGTKTVVALLATAGRKLRISAQERLKSADFPSLERLLRKFLAKHNARIEAAGFGVAGPVSAGRCVATNLPWVVNSASLRRALPVKRVALLNDLEAMAYGIEALPASSFAVLNPGCPQSKGNRAVLAAGTGLGEAALVWEGVGYRAVASEGGHADFAPRNELEVELWRDLRARFGHVSYERVLSGPGKVAIYEFLKRTGRGNESSAVTKQLTLRDPSPRISELALLGRSARCVQALNLFMSIYGAEAGNVALKFLATGGIYLGGGIAPSILPLLKRGAFMKAFTDKGRFSAFLSRVPVRVILEERAALLGAAHYVLLPPKQS